MISISVLMDSCQNNIDDVAFGLSYKATRKTVIDSCANRQVIIINIVDGFSFFNKKISIEFIK